MHIFLVLYQILIKQMSVKLLQLLKAMYYYDCIISKRKINPWLSFIYIYSRCFEEKKVMYLVLSISKILLSVYF